MKKLTKLYYNMEVRVKNRPMKYLVVLLILVIVAIAL